MILVLGEADDTRGFALAGATAVPCRTAADVRAALDRLGDASLRVSSVVLVSPAVYSRAREDIDRVRDMRDPPLVLVMPGEKTRTA